MSLGPVGGRQDFGPIEEPSTEGLESAQSESTQEAVFPRSGWESGQSFGAAQLQAKLGLDTEQATAPMNWRQALQDMVKNFEPKLPTMDPGMMMLYGMPGPSGSIDPSQVDPDPGPIMPMYGMPFPGGGGGIDPNPDPGPIMPMYGMPMPTPTPGPGGGGVDPAPVPDPGPIMPMYGMPVPPRGGGGEPTPIDPGMIMLYGMPPMGRDGIG